MSTTNRLEIIGAVDNAAHGEDAFIIDNMTHSQYFLVAVADGISNSKGGARAARMAIDIVQVMFKKMPSTFVAEFEKYFDENFTEIKNERAFEEIGETTLTACIISPTRQGKWLLRYVAIGDSPIIHCYPGPIGEQFPGTFLSQEVHGRPLVILNSGNVYACVNCGGDGIIGRVSKGERVFEDSDIVLLCSDGFPIEKYVLRDLKVGEESQRFLRNFATEPSERVMRDLFDRIKKEDGFSDDATIIAIKCATIENCPNREETKEERQKFENTAQVKEEMEGDIIEIVGKRQSTTLEQAVVRASRRTHRKRKMRTPRENIEMFREKMRRMKDMLVRKPDA